eukprot:680071-Pleurochrysis_carterae.AAC.1
MVYGTIKPGRQRTYARGSKYRRGSRVSRARGVPKTRKAFRRRVKKLINSAAETKMRSIQHDSFFNGQISDTGDCRQVLPSIQNGDGRGDREGDKIRLKSINIQGVVRMTNTWNNYDRTQIYLRLSVVSIKRFPHFPNAIASANFNAWKDDLLRLGENVYAMDGTISKYMMPFNPDVVTVHAERKIKLVQDFVWKGAAVDPLGPSEYVSQDLSHTTKMFNMRIKCAGKLLKYYDDHSDPENFAPMLLVSYASPSGTILPIDTAVK